MKKMTCFLLPILLLFPITPTVAHAALVARLDGAAVYDTDMNITWLADANAAAGSAFDDGVDTTDGAMSQGNALAWAASLDIAGITGWRLPSTVQPDPTCGIQTGGGRISFGFGCSGSEMGHLFYTELGGDGIPFGAPLDGILTSGDPDLALFSNIQARPGAGAIYHSATGFNAANNWRFNFNNGAQTFENRVFHHFAWAVHDGDVGGPTTDVPAPPALWSLLAAACLCGLQRVRAMQQRTRPRPAQ